MSTIHNINAISIKGEETALSDFHGKTLLIVNVASACGLTPQYSGLEKLHQQYFDQGLVIMGFPCNQFGEQEPGTEEEIQAFCSTNYNVTFLLFAKIEVNGPNRHPLYKQLIGNGEDITWNFEKFLVDGEGQIIRRFPPATTPEDSELTSTINEALS